MNTILDIFSNPDLNTQLLQELEATPDPRSRYIIAMTPRSGSTYLCDVIKQTRRLGKPQEILGAIAVSHRITKTMPGRTTDEYLRNGIRIARTANNVSGLKASWFQFEKFTEVMAGKHYLKGFKYVYLTRRDLAAQAVSLYKAASSEVFHSHVSPSEAALAKLDALDYDYHAIKGWYDHIVAQEKGWQRYFFEHRIYPYCLSYEDIEEDILMVLKRLAMYVSVNPDNIQLPTEPSAIQKLRDDRSREWTQRFRTQLTLNLAH